MTDTRRSADASGPPRSTRRDPAPGHSGNGQIVIGIVDNMPPGASHTAGRQFRDLLSDVAADMPLRLQIFSTPELLSPKRGAATDELWTSKLDGLIVTGTEPLARRVTDEPCWPLLARLVDWAEDNTISTVWSCLAAHAAVYRLDGIERRALGTKLFGIFDCTNLRQHAIFDECPAQWKVPHSRCNDLPEDVLLSRGYRILTHSPVAGVDSFMKQDKSLHLFLQGHPEYDLAALSREYRRDVRRFLAGEGDRYPEMPVDYFATETAAALMEFRARTANDRNPGLIAHFPQNATPLSPTALWRHAATRIYRNWLAYLVGRRSSRIAAAEHRGVQCDSAPFVSKLGPAESV